MAQASYILTVQCKDRVGIVAGVSGLLADLDCFIMRSRSFGDPDTGNFFLRLQFSPPERGFNAQDFQTRFAGLAEKLGLGWKLYRDHEKLKTLILTSKTDHCANALLYAARIGDLPIEPTAILSNHETLKEHLAHWKIPYRFVPVAADAKEEAEAAMFAIMEETQSDLVVLARYMQVLTPQACARLAGRCINIHHSFLPGFKGARPYHRAHERGVKVIGATAHYVTSDLDEGPIIAQITEPVSHHDSVDDLISIGRGLEAQTLVKAVKAHAERRVFLNGAKTVVLS